MDMFKLLARGTNIQKSDSVKKNNVGANIPSAGPSKHAPRLFKDGVSSHDEEEQEYRGVKRKRVSLGSHPGDSIPEELDFYGGGPSLTPRLTDSGRSNGEGEVLKAESTEGKYPELSETECRQILKQHKVKTTILAGTQTIHNDLKHQPTSHKDTRVQIFPHPLTSFRNLRSKYGISKRLAANLEAQGYKEPTEVQLGSLPILLGSNGDRGLDIPEAEKRKIKRPLRADVDLFTIAPTGSGKTLAFMIHLLHKLMKERQALTKSPKEEHPTRGVRALIVAPTHELADQIVNEGRKLALGTGVKVAGLKKGMRLHPELVDEHQQVNEDGSDGGKTRRQINYLVKSDVLVSTPPLLLNAISTNGSTILPVPDVRFLVLDEADVLLDPIFREQTLGIWTACSHPSLRTSLWSATIGSSIESLAQRFILDRRRSLGLSQSSKDPSHHIIRLVVGLKDSAIPNVSHRLVYSASEQGKLLALRQLLHPSATPTTVAPSLQPPFLIFTQTIPRAIALHSELLYDVPIEAGGSSRIAVLHADLSDTARSNIMADFRKGEIWILITTDLLSRGIDFRGINGVVNYDIPNTSASYIHRVGRTGRQGRQGGVAVTLYTKEDIPYVKNVANVIAASERAKGQSKGEGEGVQKWLLDALPDVSKKTKKELKRRGVESRRATVEKEGGREARKMRISTKSGYERRLENKRKGAVAGTRRRAAQAEAGGEEGSDEEWGGIVN